MRKHLPGAHGGALAHPRDDARFRTRRQYVPIIIVVLHHAAQRLLGRDRAKHSRKCAHYETIAPKGLHFEAQTLQGIELMPQILRFLRRSRLAF